MKQVTDDELKAFATGDLPEERCEEIALLLEADASLNARLETLMDHLESDDGIRAAFAGILDQPVPRSLLDSVVPPPMISNVVSFAQAKQSASRPRRYWATGLSMAASVALGLIVGSQFMTGSGGDSGSGETLVLASADGPIASNDLARMLSQLPGGEVKMLEGAGRARMSISFRDGDGRLCRQFSVEGETAATDGAACWKAQQWRIEAVGTRAIEAGEVRTASGEAAEPVLAAVDALIAGEPLDAAAEAKALKQAQ